MDYILCGILVINGLRGRFSRSNQARWCQIGAVRALQTEEDEEGDISLMKVWNNRLWHWKK